MSVDPEKVKELREKTGLPMMECKRALEKTEGDVEKAYEDMRKGGLKAQAKLAGRAAKEGKIGSYVSPDGKLGVIVALRCETEPVSKNDELLNLLAGLVETIARQKPKSQTELEGMKLPNGETVAQGITELVNKIRENITLGKFACFQADAVSQYVHFDNKKAAMVAFKGGSVSNPKVADLGKKVGMHIVFSKPLCLARGNLDPKIVEKEREIQLAAAKNDPKNAKKPEEILKKIIEGQVDKYVASNCLLEQLCIHDEKQTVEAYVKSSGTGVTLTDFTYIATDLA